MQIKYFSLLCEIIVCYYITVPDKGLEPGISCTIVRHLNHWAMQEYSSDLMLATCTTTMTKKQPLRLSMASEVTFDLGNDVQGRGL